MKHCSVCSHQLIEIYKSQSNCSITSLAVLLDGQTVVYGCKNCSHLETAPIFDLERYYDTDYKINALSADEDDLYAIHEVRKVFRSEHMASVFMQKMLNFRVQKVLDYGCGKSQVLKIAMNMDPELDAYLFDVSRDYESYWNSFRPADKYAYLSPPAYWEGIFDCVTSFFSLEHVPDPIQTLRQIHSLLREEGLVYVMVPNIYSVNKADLLVVDHLHHYSHMSMRRCMSASGFQLIEVDNNSHLQASIYIARKNKNSPNIEHINQDEAAEILRDAIAIASDWRSVQNRLKVFEAQADLNGIERFFIYGAGIVGVFLYSSSKYKHRIKGFIDSNPFKQSRNCCGLPVYGPQMVEFGVQDGLIVGLNAGMGEAIVANLPGFAKLGNHVFYC